MGNLETVKHVYDAFMRGDGAAILATFHPKVEFRLAQGHPYQPSGEPWIGGDAVAQNFFARAAGEWEGWSITPSAFLEPRDAVVVECRYTGLYKPTAKRMDVQVCHVWRFAEGKITSFHQYLDTAHLRDIMT
jgi:ketosteroid isomerase-like protein